MAIIIRNITSDTLPIDNLNVEDRILPPSVDVDLTQYNKVYEIQADPQIQSYVSNNQCTLNDGTRDLTLEEAINVVMPVISTANMYKFNETPEKVDVHGNDLFLIEDSEDDFKKKKVSASNILIVGSGTIVYTPERLVETELAYTKSTSPIVLHGMTKTIEDAGNYEVEFSGQFACLKGWEIVFIAIFVDNIMINDTRRILEAESYVTGPTDALLLDLQAGQTVSIGWWTDRGRKVIAEARSLKIRRYI